MNAITIIAPAPALRSNANPGACVECQDLDDVEGDPSTWPSWTDEVWGLAPSADGETRGQSGEDLGPCDPEDDDEGFGEELLNATNADGPTLAELADVEAEAFAAMGTDEGIFLASLMTALAERIRSLGATTVAEFIERDAADDRRS